MFSILIVEPDIPLATTIYNLLDRQSYFIKISHTLTTAYELLETRPFDVVIAAYQLPDGMGVELVEYLHRYSFQTRSMVLAKGTTYHDRIAAYKKGVDDFLVKPFNLNEFWYRLNLLCHRQKILQRYELKLCDGVAVYPEEGLLNVDSKSIVIPKKESKLLTCLLTHRTRVVGRDELMRWVWQEGDSMPKDITLDVYIKRIRIKLGRYSHQLQTVRGFGYRIRE
jgi:DNA-binding response OmpR family regulator